MSLSDLIIRIRAVFHGKPIEDAKKSVGDLGKGAKEAGQSGEQAMNLMGTASAAANGNISGVAEGVVRLTGKMKLLGMSMMQLSLVAAVLTSLVKLFQAIGERADQMAQNLRAIQSGNVTAAVDRITASYAKMREETERAQKSRDALFDVNMQELEAVKKLELAQIQLNKQRELGTAKTDQERAAIESKYKRQEMDRAKISNDAAAGFQRELLGAKANESDDAARAAQEEIDALMQQLGRRQQQTSYAQGEATRLASGGTAIQAITGGSRLRRSEGLQQEANTGRADVAKLITAIEGLQKTVADNIEAAHIYRKQADIAGIDIQTSAVQDTTARTALDTDDRMRAEREAARRERERLQAALDAAEERKAATVESRNETKQRLTFRASTEQAEATAAQAARSPLARKEQAEARAAAQAVQAYAAETTAILKQLEASMKAQRDALKRLPN